MGGWLRRRLAGGCGGEPAPDVMAGWAWRRTADGWESRPLPPVPDEAYPPGAVPLAVALIPTTRRFELHRDRDVTGTSGTGVVVDGVCFDDGTVVIHWRGKVRSTAMYASVHELVDTHGHDGATRLVWVDE